MTIETIAERKSQTSVSLLTLHSACGESALALCPKTHNNLFSALHALPFKTNEHTV